ncbi:hypothetical protein HYN43_020410 [Mucilaginibacter celer]|uniref:Uncharacterized protein n=1 Tax=Mucilaginibacter celer TaxID=2305508 RepID=A0A494W1V9_9SPHI|nr:hypothetical protein HYN43_020410 [Mucilaginibacter celer]
MKRPFNISSKKVRFYISYIFQLQTANSKLPTESGRCLRPGFTLQVLALPTLNPARAPGFPLQSLTLPAHRSKTKDIKAL